MSASQIPPDAREFSRFFKGSSVSALVTSSYSSTFWETGQPRRMHGLEDSGIHEPNLLLLLLLFVIGPQIHSRKHWSRLNHHARSRLFRRWSIGGTHRHRYAKLALRFTLVHTPRRRNIRIIASDGYPNMTIATDQVVRRVEGCPTQARNQCF